MGKTKNVKKKREKNLHPKQAESSLEQALFLSSPVS
jgi:hypothetical protein